MRIWICVLSSFIHFLDSPCAAFKQTPIEVIDIDEIVPLESVEQAVRDSMFRLYVEDRDRIISDSRMEKEAEIREAIKSRLQTGFFLMRQGESAGLILFRECVAFLQVTHFYVPPAFRDSGAGRVLMERLKGHMSGRRELVRIFSVILTELTGLCVDDMKGLGFRIYERYTMERDLSGEISAPPPGENFSIVAVQEPLLWRMAEALHSGGKAIIDRELRPGVFDTPWTCFLFLRQIYKGLFGVFNFHTSLVLFDGEKVIGGIFGTYKLNGEAFIPAFFIHRDYQGKGLGGALLEALLVKLREYGILKVSLCVTATNENATALYRKRGFQISLKYYEAIFDIRDTL